MFRFFARWRKIRQENPPPALQKEAADKRPAPETRVVVVGRGKIEIWGSGRWPIVRIGPSILGSRYRK